MPIEIELAERRMRADRLKELVGRRDRRLRAQHFRKPHQPPDFVVLNATFFTSRPHGQERSLQLRLS
jgi:hypothetical protein